jgi:hypothetical protein
MNDSESTICAYCGEPIPFRQFWSGEGYRRAYHRVQIYLRGLPHGEPTDVPLCHACDAELDGKLQLAVAMRAAERNWQ